MPILLFGATSILGFNLARLFPDGLVPFTSPGNSAPLVQNWPTLNLEDPDWVETVFSQYRPAILLYCHAVCDVPKCEADPDWAYQINVQHLQRVVRILPKHTRLVYVSSDHVFGGDGIYDEEAAPCPISVYGRTRVEAEHLILNRPQSLVIRTGLAIGSSPNGRSGHLDWLRYRTHRNLPITIVEDEYRSTVWVEDLAVRVMTLTRSHETGIRHVTATQAISRVELANYLFDRLGQEAHFHRESRHQRPAPHIGRVELASVYTGELSRPLSSVLDQYRMISTNLA
ncbi:MAG: NAD(P)-dependent oxidoreductase [Nitrospirales bacterium]